MKGMLAKNLILVILILSMTINALAGDSVSLTMSCTIPAVPGLNAPFIEKETTKIQPPVSPVIEQQIMPLEAQPETPAMIQEDGQSTKENPEETAQIVMVKTFYSR